MSKLTSWLGSVDVTQYKTVAERAVDTWNIIQDKKTSIQIFRDGSYLTSPYASQDVRIEYLEQGFVQRGSNLNETTRESVFIMGVKNHPNTSIRNTNIKRGDRFYIAAYDMTVVVITIDFTNEWLVSATAIATEAN